jgi:uncharacterized repeat protein (TIGR03803 family)
MLPAVTVIRGKGNFCLRRSYMPSKRPSIALRAIATFAVGLVATSGWAATNWQEKVLHNFNGMDGEQSQAGLIFDAAGNLYGTTANGGTNTCGGSYGCGTVFELSPMAGGGWTETVLHNFEDNGSDGFYPQASLIFDAAGNLYGTTVNGGTSTCGGGYGCGTVFELSPKPGGGWTETVLHSFGDGTDGANPYWGGLIFDAAGNLYGTTTGGGTDTCPQYGCGTVFELSPTGGGAWTETVLYSFHRGSDGHVPAAGLTMDATGNLFGTTTEGGTGNCLTGQTHGCGTVFELSPTSGGRWTEAVLHNFGSGSDGIYPTSSLTFDSAGNLYGTTQAGGIYDFGTVFELMAAAGGGWTETVVYTFNDNGADGYAPAAGALIFDAAGNLYGTTTYGGAYFFGTVFKLTPTVRGTWTETLLHEFAGPDGYSPWAGVIFDATGNLYGTTINGGTHQCNDQDFGCGTVFELMPVVPCIRCSPSILQ